MPHASNDRRESKRALLIGLGVSVAIHALAFAFLGLNVTVAPDEEPMITFDAVESPVEVIEIVSPVQTADATGGQEGAPGAAGPAAPAQGALTAPVAAVPDVGDPLLAAVDEEDLVPVTNVVVDAPVTSLVPVAVSLPEAGAPAEETETQVYVPGSVGKAKRGWAEDGLASGRNGNGPGFFGTVGVGIGDPHCPMPGRGRGRPIVPPRSR
jgi:hypothetical protein